MSEKIKILNSPFRTHLASADRAARDELFQSRRGRPQQRHQRGGRGQRGQRGQRRQRGGRGDPRDLVIHMCTHIWKSLD